MLICFPVNVQGQKNILKGIRSVRSNPTLLVRLPKHLKTGAPPPKMLIFPENTPKQLIQQRKQEKGCIYRTYELPRNFKLGDSLKLNLGLLHHQEYGSIGKLPVAKTIVYSEIYDNYALFPLENMLIPSDFDKVNLAFSIGVYGEPRPILTDEIGLKVAKMTSERGQGRPEDSLFHDKIEIQNWKGEFCDFLKTFPSPSSDYSIKTKLSNYVSQVYYSFMKRWEEMKVIEKVSGDASLRFLVDECGFDLLVGNRRTYSGWFLKNYKEGKLYDERIDNNVEEWFILRGLKK